MYNRSRRHVRRERGHFCVGKPVDQSKNAFLADLPPNAFLADLPPGNSQNFRQIWRGWSRRGSLLPRPTTLVAYTEGGAACVHISHGSAKRPGGHAGAARLLPVGRGRPNRRDAGFRRALPDDERRPGQADFPAQRQPVRPDTPGRCGAGRPHHRGIRPASVRLRRHLPGQIRPGRRLPLYPLRRQLPADAGRRGPGADRVYRHFRRPGREPASG